MPPKPGGLHLTIAELCVDHAKATLDLTEVAFELGSPYGGIRYVV
jgi:hypothetical protein